MHRRRGLTATIVGLISIALVVGAVGAVGAADNAVSAKLSGKNEVPGPGDKNGSGEAVLKLNKKKLRISFNISFEGIQEPVAGHLHKGTRHVADPAEAKSHRRNLVLFGEQANVTSPVSGRVKWNRNYTPDQKKQVIKRIKNNPNNWYVNLHTPDFPDGAIRGQLKPGG
jgi:CHRD domain